MLVLDTDTCIEILRGNKRVILRRAETEEDVATTAMTAGELFYGAHKSIAPEHNRALVETFLASMEILEFEHIAASFFGEFRAHLERKGERLADADLIIASTALAHGATLITGNEKHMRRIPGLRVQNWIR